MAGSKEIKTKIKSVQNTRKITKAMEMVAASKMRKAQERTRAARPYAEKIRNVAAHLSHANPEYRHPHLVARGRRQAAHGTADRRAENHARRLHRGPLRPAGDFLHQIRQHHEAGAGDGAVAAAVGREAGR